MITILVNVKQSTKMSSINQSTRDKIREYVRNCTDEGKYWEDNAETIVHLIENGRIISAKDIVYDEDGTIARIKGTEVKDGVLLLKEKKKVLKAIPLPDNTPIPFVEKLRAQRKVIVL